jgi:bacterioferritin-associated ferredoxin
MYACVCFCITEEEIHDEISAGARTEEELGERCGAGTSCGTCVERLGCLIEEARSRPAVEQKLAACPAVCEVAARANTAIAA